MESKDYLKFCHDTYRDELKDRDQFIPRQGFLLTGIVVLGGLIVKLSVLDRLPRIFERVDIFFYYLGIIGGLASLVAAIYFLAQSVCPRTYEQLESLAEFDKWRNDIRATLNDAGYVPEEIEQQVATLTNNALIERMNAATDRNASQNLTRAMYFNRSIYSVFLAVSFLTLEMLAALIYELVRIKGA